MLPTEIGLPFEVPGTWTLELIATTTLGTQPGASGPTFLVAHADGTVATDADADHARRLPVEVNVVDRSTTDGAVRHHHAADAPTSSTVAAD